MKGISAKVSRTLSHLDLPRVIIHANGIPATKSNAETTSAIIKEFNMAPSAKFISSGWSKMFWIEPTFVTIPIMGGIRIIAKKITTAEM